MASKNLYYYMPSQTWKYTSLKLSFFFLHGYTSSPYYQLFITSENEEDMSFSALILFIVALSSVCLELQASRKVLEMILES